MHLSRAISTITVSAAVLLCAGCGPSTAPEHLQAAAEYRSHDQLANAIIHAKNSVQLDPQNPSTYQMLGDLYFSLDKPRAALRAYEAAKARGIDSPKLVLAELKAKLDAGLYEQVIDEIGQSETRSPEKDTILAEAYLDASDYDKARALYRKFEDPGRYAVIGRLERKSGRYESALQAYKKAFTVYPEAETLLALARMQRFFDPGASIGSFQQLAGLKGFELTADSELVRTHWLMGDDQAAANHLVRLVQNEPNRRHTKFLRGIYELRRGNWDAAFSELLILYITSPRDDLLLPLALVEYEMGSYTAARIYAQRLLFRDPLNESAAKLLFLTSDDFNHPMTRVVKRLQDVSHDPQLLRMIGEFELRAGHTETALRAFTRARRALGQPDDARVRFAIDLGLTPGRARLFMPLQSARTANAYADNCFGLAGSLDVSQDPTDAGPCREEVLKFLLGLRALNASDHGRAAELFEGALQIDPRLAQARLLLARMHDPRYSKTGFRLAGPPSKEDYPFGHGTFLSEPSGAQWDAIESNYADLVGLGSYEVLVVQAELMLSKGQTGPALVILNRLTKTHPSRIDAYSVLAKLNMQRSRGRKWLRSVRKEMIDPLWDSWEMRLIRAQIYEQSNDLKRASQTARHLQDPVDLYPSFPAEGRLELAELQLRLGQRRLAVQNFHQVADDPYAAVEIKNTARERLAGLHQPAARRVASAAHL